MAKVLNSARLERRLRSMKRKITANVRRGIYQAAEFILDKSQDIVPVDVGELKESGHLEKKGNEVAIVYEAEHAVIVHEDLEARHAPPTQAKYLEQPLRVFRRQMQTIIRREGRSK